MSSEESGAKRALEEDNSSNKRVDTQSTKGVAFVKPEYIVSPSLETQYNDDAAESSKLIPDSSETKSKKRRGGQNKNRDLKQVHEEIRLCSSLVDPELGKTCKFGAEKCRNEHDIDKYLSSKPADIEGMCPVFKAVGYCPAGLKCRWLNSHYQDGKLVKTIEFDGNLYELKNETNNISMEAKNSLQKKTFKFPKTDLYLPYIDSQVIREETPKGTTQDEVKEKMNTYVEPPFKPSEKKKLYYKNAKILSPLTTVGNLPFRRLMKTMGCDVTYSEMALGLPLVQGNNSEWALPKAHKSEYPGFGVQIATSKLWQLLKLSELIYETCPSVSELNLNCGCPIDLLYRQGQGSALLDQPPRLVRILKTMNACSGDIPTTVKIRMGTRDGHLVADNIVRRVMTETDVSAITLHGRTRQQRYTREADWDYIAQIGSIVKELNESKLENKELSDSANPTWFIGNGDIYNFGDWYDAIERPGIDSCMVARGALIKPWIFEEIEAQQYIDKSSTERLEILKKYADFAIEHWGSDEYGINNARRYLCEFLSFFHRYIPYGILERVPAKLNQRPPVWKGRDELETLLGSTDYKDWIKITEMFLGPASDSFMFQPKHKSNSYEKSRD